jgi:hypothetical protein
LQWPLSLFGGSGSTELAILLLDAGENYQFIYFKF